MRRPIIAGNWKMNNGVSEAKKLATEILELDLSKDVEAVLCTPAIDLYPVKELI